MYYREFGSYSFVDTAASAGANIVRFQSFRAADLLPNDSDFDFVSKLTLKGSGALEIGR